MSTIIVVATTDPGYSRAGAGAGWNTQASGGYQGGPWDYDNVAGETATFASTLPQAGTYKLAITYFAGVNRSADVGVAVLDGAATVLSRTLDQTAAPADFIYNTSGFVYLSMSLAFVTTSASVVLTVPGTVYTVADAVYFELISPPPATRRRGGMARSLRRIVANFALPAPTGPAVIPGPARSGRL